MIRSESNGTMDSVGAGGIHLVVTSHGNTHVSNDEEEGLHQETSGSGGLV